MATDPAGGDFLTEKAFILRLLQECCTARTDVLLVEYESAEVLRGRFIEVDSTSVALEVVTELSHEMLLQPPSVCLACFTHRRKARTFITRALDVKGPMEHLKIATIGLEIPASVSGVATRMASRVPVFEQSKLEVTLTNSQGRSTKPTALNVSHSGILVELHDEWEVTLALGEVVDVSLRLGEHSITVSGAVRRRNEQRYGLFFKETLPPSEPPPQLTAIVAAVQSSWPQPKSRA